MCMVYQYTLGCLLEIFLLIWAYDRKWLESTGLIGIVVYKL